MRLGGPQCGSGTFGEESLASDEIRTPDLPIHSLESLYRLSYPSFSYHRVLNSVLNSSFAALSRQFHSRDFRDELQQLS